MLRRPRISTVQHPLQPFPGGIVPAKKKRAAKKSAAKKSSGGMYGGKPCTPKNMCDYIQALDAWLWNEFWPDYVKVRNAVCNLDKVAIRKLPNTPAAMLCPGAGGGAEPPVVQPPPKW